MTAEEVNEEPAVHIQPKLQLITGGKGSPPSSGENWLGKMNKNAVFTCKQKGCTDQLRLLIIAFKHGKTIVLVDGLNNSPREAVDPVEFCKKHSFFELIEEGGERPEDGEHDGTRAIRLGELGDDADAEGRQQEPISD